MPIRIHIPEKNIKDIKYTQKTKRKIAWKSNNRQIKISDLRTNFSTCGEFITIGGCGFLEGGGEAGIFAVGGEGGSRGCLVGEVEAEEVFKTVRGAGTGFFPNP